MQYQTHGGLIAFNNGLGKEKSGGDYVLRGPKLIKH